jgi:hypothetical protein
LKTYGEITTVKTAYDPVYKEVFFYISDGTLNNTSIINEYTNSFTGRHTFTPDLMLNLNDQFYSVKDNTVYLHNYGNYGEFYGVVSDSTISSIVNPNGTSIKRFDILELRVDVIDGSGVYQETEQFDHIDINNNYQSILNKALVFSGDDSFNDTTKSIARKWRIWLLPDDYSTDFYRMVDTHIKYKLYRHNTDNKKIVLHDMLTHYRTIKN